MDMMALRDLASTPPGTTFQRASCDPLHNQLHEPQRFHLSLIGRYPATKTPGRAWRANPAERLSI
jgi:hypothetical protein